LTVQSRLISSEERMRCLIGSFADHFVNFLTDVCVGVCGGRFC